MFDVVGVQDVPRQIPNSKKDVVEIWNTKISRAPATWLASAKMCINLDGFSEPMSARERMVIIDVWGIIIATKPISACLVPTVTIRQAR